MFNSHVHNNEGCFGKHTHINIFGECVSESVQDRENEIHVKDGGWWIAFLHFALSADLYELASFILTPLAGNWSKKWGEKRLRSCDVLTERRRMGGGAICPKNNHMNQCSSTLLWRGRESEWEWEHRGWREKRVRQWLKITVCVGYVCICVCDMCLIRANLDCFSSNCTHTDI